MIKINLSLAMFLIAVTANGQQFNFKPLDVSQADFAYFPAKAVKVSVGDAATPLIKVIYSRPAAKARTIFGGLQPFGKLWRIGANESTEIRFFKAVKLGGKDVAAGAYTLFAIPEEDKWEIILNAQTDTWGPYGYDARMDILRFSVPVQKLRDYTETLSIVFTDQPAGAMLVIGWEKTYVEVPITIHK